MMLYVICSHLCFFFNDTATTEIYTLSLHDALPIYVRISLHDICEYASTSTNDGRKSPKYVAVSVFVKEIGRAHV